MTTVEALRFVDAHIRAGRGRPTYTVIGQDLARDTGIAFVDGSAVLGDHLLLLGGPGRTVDLHYGQPCNKMDVVLD